MKRVLLNILKYVITFLLIIIIINISLFLVCLIDSKLLKKHVNESSNILLKQEMFQPVKDISLVYNNNYTDAQIMNELYSIDNRHPYTSYMKVRRNYNKNITKKELEDVNGDGLTIRENNKHKSLLIEENYNTIEELRSFLDGKINYSINSGRYWHGYLIIYRPLIILFNISQLRTFLLVTFIILFTILIYLIYKKFDIYKAIIYASTLLFTNYFSVHYSLESTPVFLIMMISSIVLLLRLDKIKNFSLFIFIVGCLTSIFDYLTVPLITLGIPCSIYLLKLLKEKKDWKYYFKFIIINSIIWLIGFICAWFFKWILYDLTISGTKSMIEIGITQCLFRVQRISNTVYLGVSVWDRLLDFVINMPLYIVGTLLLVIILRKFKYSINVKNKSIYSLLLIALMPIVWYLVLANHTIIHFHFVHRHILLFMLGILLFLDALLFSNSSKKKTKKR